MIVFLCVIHYDIDAMNASTLDHLIAKNHLKDVAGEVHSLLKESIRLVGNPVDHPPPGTSHLGGMPDLPDGSAWPAWQGKPMSFVAQIRLEDIARFPPAHDLPSSGLLSFFYDAAQETYGASPEDRGGWKVAYFETAASLKPAAFPDALPAEARFKALALQFKSEFTLPVSAQQMMPGLNWNNQQEQAYEALLQQYQDQGDRKQPKHRMFGWPDQIQDDMQLQAAMMTSGVTDVNDPRAKAAETTKSNWELLLQVDSDDRAGMRWASYGMIYYWIEMQALKARQFDQTWFVLQSE